MSQPLPLAFRSRVALHWGLLGALTCLVLVSYLARHWIAAWWHDRPVQHRVPKGMVDDASRQNATPVREVRSLPLERQAAELRLAALLKFARDNKLKVSIAGSRHSMGGHTISSNGIVIDTLRFNSLSLNSQTLVLTCGAGAKWSEILPYLDAQGFSIRVMQSNNDFTVGGSISVNCHGWQHNQPPIAATVESLRLMRSDGSVVVCSRTENASLFSHVLGGYGLLGIILEVNLRVVPNVMYQPHATLFSAADYVTRFREMVDQSDEVGMVFGRLCVVPGEATFLKEAVLTVFRATSTPLVSLKSQPAPERDILKREIFRGQIGNPDGKRLRWQLETSLGGQAGRKPVSRNYLLNTSAILFQEQNADHVDILQEYFIPPEQVAAFLVRAQMIIPRHSGDLLNVTIRNVRADPDSVMRYALGERFAFVFLFHQSLDADGDQRMQAMTRELVSAALEVGGSYYLPYRLHARPDQFRAAYPQAEAFFEQKRRWDPNELFSNAFYERYGK